MAGGPDVRAAAEERTLYLDSKNGAGRDWVARRGPALLAWGVPIAALIVATSLDHPAKTLTWFVALGWMGLACLVNARRCGRVHCYFTGPFFVLAGGLALAQGYGVLPLGDRGWLWLGLGVGIGGFALTVLPERLWGRYRQRG